MSDSDGARWSALVADLFCVFCGTNLCAEGRRARCCTLGCSDYRRAAAFCRDCAYQRSEDGTERRPPSGGEYFTFHVVAFPADGGIAGIFCAECARNGGAVYRDYYEENQHRLVPNVVTLLRRREIGLPTPPLDRLRANAPRIVGNAIYVPKA